MKIVIQFNLIILMVLLQVLLPHRPHSTSYSWQDGLQQTLLLSLLLPAAFSFVLRLQERGWCWCPLLLQTVHQTGLRVSPAPAEQGGGVQSGEGLPLQAGQPGGTGGELHLLLLTPSVVWLARGSRGKQTNKTKMFYSCEILVFKVLMLIYGEHSNILSHLS